MEMAYTVGDLKKIVAESSNEFKAVIGDNVESENKKNNKGKTHDEISKEHYGQKLEAPKIADYVKNNPGKGMLDYEIDNASKEWKKKVHAQVDGYDNLQSAENGLPKEGDREENEKFYQGTKECGKTMQDNQRKFKQSGLRSRMLDPKTFDRGDEWDDSKIKTNESKEGFAMRDMIDSLKNNTQSTPTIQEHIKTVYFKKTAFLNEEHMISRIPDEFKNEGAQFKMKDKTGNEYLVEWTNNNGHIIGHNNKQGMNESLERMKSLMSYSTKDTETTQSYRINEGENVLTDMLNKTRNIK